MLADIALHEWIPRHDLKPIGSDLIKRAFDQSGPDAFALKLFRYFRVGERDDVT